MSEPMEEYVDQFDELYNLSDEGLDDVTEPYALPDGTEARVRIINIHSKKRDDGTQYWLVTLEPVEHPYAKLITHFVELPQYVQDPRRKNSARFKRKEFIEAFGFSTSDTVKIDDFVGREGWAILSLQRSAQYGEQNRIAEFIPTPY